LVPSSARAAGHGHGSGRIAHGDADEPGLRHGLQVPGSRAKVMAVAHAGQRQALAARAGHGLPHGQLAGGEGKAVAGIDPHGGGALRHHARYGLPVHTAGAQKAGVHGHA
jgi:hypothetical protein